MKKIVLLMLLIFCTAQPSMAFRLFQKTEKPSPVASDVIGVEDSADSYNVKSVELGNLPVSTPTQTALDAKANTATTYSKTEVDSAISSVTVGSVVQLTSTEVVNYVDASGVFVKVGEEAESAFTTWLAGLEELSFSSTYFIETDVTGGKEISIDPSVLSTGGVSALVDLSDWTVGLLPEKLGFLSTVTSNIQDQINGISVGSPVVTAPVNRNDTCVKGQYAYSGDGLTKYDCVDTDLWFTSALSNTLSDLVTHSLTLNISGQSGADAINGFTTSQVITGLTADYTITGVLGDSTDITCTNTTGGPLVYVAGTASDDVTADCVFNVASAFPPETLTLLDDFDRATIGTDWTTITNQNAMGTVLSSRATGLSTARYGMYYNQITPANNQCVDLDIKVISEQTGAIYLRASAIAESGYVAAVESGTTMAIKKLVDGSFTTLSAVESVTWADYDTLRFCATGTTLTAYQNGTEIVSVTDSTFPSGEVGMFAYGEARLDNFSADTQ